MLIICLLSLVQELRALITETSRNLFSSTSSSSSHVLSLSQRADGSRSAQYSFSKAVLVSQAGGCRVLSYCEPLSCLLASQPSPHTTLVPGETSFFPLDKCDSLSLTPELACVCVCVLNHSTSPFSSFPPFRVRGKEGQCGEHEGESVRSHPQQTDPRSVLQQAERQPAAVCCIGQHYQTDQVRARQHLQPHRGLSRARL